MNRKGSIADGIYIIIIIFVIGLILFFFNHLNEQLYDSFDKYFNKTEEFNETTGDSGHVRESLGDLIRIENSKIYDYGFLFIVFGFMVVLGLTAFLTRISPIFYWIYGFLSLLFLVLAVAISSIWQSLSNNPEFSETLSRFPIMNTFLGSYYPTLITMVLVLFMVFLFGKPATKGGIA